jgi:hypothetical protein
MDKVVTEVLNSFTENNLQGNGYFDRIMSSVELHIHDEFDKNRITGANYAQSYIAALQAGLQCSTQLLMEAPNIEIKKLEVEKAKIELEGAKLQLEKIKLEMEKLKLDIDLSKAELEIKKVELEIKKAQLELIPYQKELMRWQAVSEQANTCDIVNNGEDAYDGATSNIHGLFGQNITSSKHQIDVNNKAAYLNAAKEMVLNPFSVIESAEGVGASYFGLNGSNGVSILNAVRKMYGMPELDESTYAGEHKPYMNTYAPDVNLETDD